MTLLQFLYFLLRKNVKRLQDQFAGFNYVIISVHEILKEVGQKFNMNKISFKVGLALSTLAVLFFTYNAFIEYMDCSPGWPSMCGTGILFLSLTAGLVLPVFTGLFMDFIIDRLNLWLDFSLSQDLHYIINAGVVILTVGITYFIVGYFLGWVYRKITNK